ncbi:MAG: TlpA family protein disulfide reductase [Proteocatella sp.]
MKKLVGILMIVVFAITLLTACGNSGSSSSKTDKSQNQVTTLTNGMKANNKFDKNKMVTIGGNEYFAKGKDYTYAEKDMGMGIVYTDLQFECNDKQRLQGVVFPPFSLLFALNTEKGLEFSKSAESLSEEEYQKKKDEIGEYFFDLYGVFRYEKGATEVEQNFKEWKARFAEVEELCEFSGGIYYFGYNKDYSGLKTEKSDRELFDKAISELPTIRDNICIFPLVIKDAFSGNFNKFNTTTLNGKEANQDVFKNYDVTMVNVWATWCGPCVEELPEIGELHKKLPKNINIITICTDGEEEGDLAKEILEESNCEMTTLLSSESLNKSIIENLDGLPSTFFVDSKGNIIGEPQVGTPAEKGKIGDAYMKLIEEKLAAIEK